MELKLSVSIGATLQVKNAKGEWDWIKPEVGAELSLWESEVAEGKHQIMFAEMWDSVVGPQFRSVVSELLGTAEGAAELESNSAEGTAPDADTAADTAADVDVDPDAEPTVSAEEDYY